ncbi:peptide-n4-(n-acetyl-beta-glucosaminyl)asparagine amidase a [Ophiostoma piceae UAMH 11346]|uniref:Peptide-n4-(N-acetyl-beta-glucosaminyl)asparagine amidase a n=1 Tax=Ophiostoma piceae (strain UAMH 11346) TaxID=1262450 RepID=S3CNS7_OPHP1|nr:peptide-n4-(n-acetyl-beta-glucosaminyl)asparagine amidase a [Ophiostoma piceae UAMH 11346]
MDEAASLLLEKTQPALDLEQSAAATTHTKAASKQQRPRIVQILAILLPLALTLSLVSAVSPWARAACLGHTAKATLIDPPTATSDFLELHSPTKRDNAASQASKVLECFQVAQPVLTPAGPTTDRSPTPQGGYTVTLMDHVFGNSYGQPYVGSYVPPNVTFNRVVMNFTSLSAGVQFDRLALMYLGDTEVWRTSTAEPVASPGIRWVYLKDMTPYLSLWKTPQKIIFDLGNLLSTRYTGPFNVTLTATFFQVDEEAILADGGTSPSDLIIPISARKSASNGVSQFTLPADNATNTIDNFPRNARRAVFSVSANGQADEEFWWQNVLQSNTLSFASSVGELLGYSPFREVQVLIDGKLAGVQWPFPVVFTGGVVPGLHRPIVGADVFDLREHEIDITPWLPLLCDGKSHTFAIVVSGLNDDGKESGTATLSGTVPSSWYVTGKVFVWLDDEGNSPGSASSTSITTGSVPIVSDPGPTISVTQNVVQNATGSNTTLQYTVSVSRSFSVQGSISSGGKQGRSHPVSWSQSLSYWTLGVVLDSGDRQINNVTISGSDRATSAGSRPEQYVYSSDYSFPIYCNTTATVSPQGNLTIWAYLDQGLELHVAGASVFPSGLEAFAGAGPAGSSGPGVSGHFAGGSVLSTRTVGTASYFRTGDQKNSTGFGTTNQVFHFGGLSNAGMLGSTPDVTLYSRNVTAVNQTVTFDQEKISGNEEKVTVKTVDSTVPKAPILFAQVPERGSRGSRGIKAVPASEEI